MPAPTRFGACGNHFLLLRDNLKVALAVFAQNPNLRGNATLVRGISLTDCKREIELYLEIAVARVRNIDIITHFEINAVPSPEVILGVVANVTPIVTSLSLVIDAISEHAYNRIQITPQQGGVVIADELAHCFSLVYVGNNRSRCVNEPRHGTWR